MANKKHKKATELIPENPDLAQASRDPWLAMHPLVISHTFVASRRNAFVANCPWKKVTFSTLLNVLDNTTDRLERRVILGGAGLRSGRYWEYLEVIGLRTQPLIDLASTF